MEDVKKKSEKTEGKQENADTNDRSGKKTTRVAIIGIIVEEPGSVERMNQILHEASDYIVGRMGIPRVHGDMNVISVVVDAPEEKINSLSGKLGMCKGITSKVIMSKK